MNTTANIFIVPNCLDTISQDNINLTHWNRRLELWGLPQFKEGDVPIQIWVTSNEEDNWCDHGAPDWVADAVGGPERTKRVHFPSVIPSYLLAGLSEGESFTFVVNELTIKLKASQLKHRYSRFGRFQDVFAYVYSR